MDRKFFLTVALCLGLSQPIFGQQDPKGLLASRTVDFSQARALPFEQGDMTIYENVIVDGYPHAMVMGWKKNKLEPIFVEPLNWVWFPPIPPEQFNIEIDGDDSDWDGTAPAVVDPDGDDSEYLGQPGTDLANVRIAISEGYLYFLMTLHDGDPIQDCGYFVEFQQYLTQLHTPGDHGVMVTSSGGDPWRAWVYERPARFDGPGWEAPPDHVAVGPGFIEAKVPMWTLSNRPDTPSPYFPAGPVYRNIRNRFIRVYIHPFLGPAGVSDDNESLARPIISRPPPP